MKKITLMIFVSLLSFCGYAQLAPECFEDSWSPVPATPTSLSTSWLTLDNGVGTAYTWVQEPHSNPRPSFEGTAGTFSAFLDKENVAAGFVAKDYLVSPAFTMPAGGELKFQSRLTFAGDQGSIYGVYIIPASADPSNEANYILIQDWTEAELALSPILTYEEKLVTFGNTYNGQSVRIAFAMEGDNKDRWLLDCVSVTQQCNPVSGLTASGFTMTSANLNWTNPPGGATSWMIEIVADSAVPTGYGIVYSGALPYTATGTATGNPLVQVPFTENSNYKYYVKAICADGGTSTWVGPFFFSTTALGETCADPIAIATLPYSDTDNTGNFGDTIDGSPGASGCGSTNGYLNGNDVFYSYTATTTGTISVSLTNNGAYSGVFVYTSCANVGVSCIGGAVAGGTGVPLSIPTLAVTAGTTYYFVISTWATPQTTPYTLTIQQVFCAPPVGLATTAGMDSASLSWTNPSGADEWQVVVQSPGAGIPSAAGVTATTNTNFVVTQTFNGTPLVASTQYEYYVRADCNDGNFSAWAGPYLFNTTICTLADQCNWQFEMWDSFGDSWNGNTMTIAQNGITIATLTGPTDAQNQTHIFQTVPVCHDLPLTVYWNAGGTWAGEVGLKVINSFGQELYTKNPGTGTQNSLLYTITVDCLVPECLPPSGLTATGVTPNSANLGWAGPAAGTWDVYVVTQGSPAPTAATPGVDATTNPHPYSGLLPDTTYSFYVRVDCGGGEVSTWAGPFNFTTLPTCPKPLNLTVTAIGDDEATINWVEANTATDWEVYIVENGGAAPTAATDGVPTDVIPYTTTTLESGTIYQVWVKAVCGPGDESLWTGPVTFNTTICNVVDQCAYEFEMWDSFGDGWNGNTMTVSQNGITVATLTGPTDAQNQTHIFQTVMLCHDEPFQLFWNAGGAWVGEVGVAVINSFDQTLYTKNPGTGAQNTLLYTGEADCVTPACLPPSALTASGITIDSAVLGWTNAPATAEAWEVYVVETGGAAPTETTDGVDAGTNPFTYDQAPLVPDTTFDYYVRVVCGPDNYSIWAGPFTFTTLPTCPRPINLTVTNISDTEVDLGWTETGSATAWEVYVVENGEAAPVAATEGVDAATNPFTYGPLEPGTYYQFYVRAVCAEDDKSKWEGPFAFNTAVCPLEDQCAYVFEMWDSFGDSWNNNTMTVFQGGVPVGTLVGPTNADDLTHIFQTVNLCSGVPFTLHWNAGGAFANEVGVSITNFYDEVIYTKNPGTGAQNSDLYTAIPVCSPITCPQPTVLASTGFDLTSVILSWTPGGAETQWEVVIQAIDGAYPGETPAESVIVSEPEYHAENLVEGEFYEYYVRAICGDDDLSFWSGPQSFSIFNPSGCNIEVVDIGNPDVGTIVNGSEYVLCPEDDPCVNLSANYLETGDTGAYIVEPIDYAPPYPFTGGTPVSVGTDDVWSPLFNLPFDFCFYGDNYSSVIVGSNGVISFNTAAAGGYCPWPFTQTIPNAGFPILNAIYGVYQDILPTTFNDFANPDINVQVLGNYPCRALVVNYSEVAQFSCNNNAEVGAQTSQVVLYEVTNVIEVYVGRRVPCNGWNSGNGLIGIQNATGTVATTPPGRNTGNWTAIEEAWRFIPDGESNVVFEWLQDGEVISTDSEVEVCVEGETVMTARATYTDCNGDEVIKDSELTISIADPITTEDPVNLTACSTGEAVTFDLNDALAGMVPDPENYTFEFYATESAAVEGVAVSEPLDPEYTTDTDATVWIRIMRNGLDCFIVDSFTIDLNNVPPTFDVTDDFSICEGTSGTIEVTGGNWADGEAEFSWTLDGEALPDTTSSITVTAGGDYEVTINVGGCVGTAITTVTAVPVPQADDVADVTACDSYELPALTTGEYWTQAGGTGTQLFENDIISETQEIFVYAESGTTPNCTTETSFTVTINDSPAVTTPGDQQVCDSYVLPELLEGNYYTGPGGTGTMLEANDVVNTAGANQIWVYAETGTTPNCTDEAMFTVTVTPTPQAVTVEDVTECVSYTLPALADGNAYYTGTGASGVELAANTVINSTQEIFVYAESGTTPNCWSETSFVVTIVPTPLFNLGGPYVACNAADLTVSVNAENFTAGDATYAWTVNGLPSAETGSSIDGTEFGTYEVTVTVNGCSATESVELTQDTTVIGVSMTDECIDNVYTLTAGDIDGSFEPLTASYAWTGPNGFTASAQSAVPVDLGTYNVTVTTAEGCVGFASFEVVATQCTIQRGISPNGDGENDSFDLSTLDVSQISIFNRYGQEVYSRSNYSNEWFGQTNSGDELPTGTYFYMIERESGEQITGWIYINREE